MKMTLPILNINGHYCLDSGDVLMRPKQKTKQTQIGFTLVEMLTALAVIAVLLALLIPALNMVQKKAQTVKQRGQFHAIEVGLEAFRADWGDYPPSEYNLGYYGNGGIAPFRLAEALIGRDGLGFHPSSQFREGGLADLDGDGVIDDQVYQASTANNLAARKGPYLELETANAVRIREIYGSVAAGALDDTYVLADAFTKKMRVTGKEFGMPILYYRAHTDRIDNDPAPNWEPASLTFWATNTYDLNDSYCNNSGILGINVPFQSTSAQHPLWNCGSDVAAARLFYGAIANPNFTSPARPYRANSFLLHSAGPDGLYGTPDDMFNF
jgi:prepilin-type N-terminal cleavage/methylation domain-containing protein